MKYFVVSDVHGKYNALMRALNKAGYEKTNKNHTLIVCGDTFIGGDQCRELYDFLKSLPKKRRILICGDYEYELFDLLCHNSNQPINFNTYFLNGTLKVLCKLTGYDISTFNYIDLDHNYELDFYGKMQSKLTHFRDWLMNEWKVSFETDKYIICHSFPPINQKKPTYWFMTHTYTDNDAYEIDSNWIEYKNNYDNCLDTFPCKTGAKIKPYTAIDNMPLPKTLICGGRPTEEFYKHYKVKCKNKKESPIFISDKIIGINGNVNKTERINVFTFEE